MSTPSQLQMLAEHFKKHGQINPMDALNQYGIYRLAARVRDLRDKGWQIHTDTSEGYAVYSMVKIGAAG